jgi:lipopolysaccharide transport system ATP-binding protein
MSSSDVAISIRELSKAYTINHDGLKRPSFREIVVDRVTHPFRKPRQETFWALKDVDFEVKKGSVVGIIGRNGAGKSTLLKILSRIVEPTSGTVDLYGRVGSLLEVGTGFHPELTGRENIYLNGAIMGMQRAEIKRQFDAIVNFAEVERFLDTPVKRYSSGMYVRLAFAVAAHLNPEILIVDEVLAVGDAQFQKKCIGKMKDVSTAEGRTVLFVSHNMGAVRSLCDSAVWLASGKLKESGSVDRLVTDYIEMAIDIGRNIVDCSRIGREHTFGTQMKVTRIVFNEGTPILHGEPLLIRMEYEAFSYVESVAVGLGISTMDGTRILSIDTDVGGRRFPVGQGKQGYVEGRLEALHLQPGRYLVDFGIRSGDNHGVDYVPGGIHVEVLPGPRTPPMIIRESGGMRVPLNWSGNHYDESRDL